MYYLYLHMYCIHVYPTIIIKEKIWGENCGTTGGREREAWRKKRMWFN